MPYKSKEKRRDYMRVYNQVHRRELRLKNYLRKKGIKSNFIRKGRRMSIISEFKKGDRTYLGTKKCLNCKEIYQMESGPQKYCKRCSPNHRAYHFMKTYGLNLIEYQRLMNKYNGLCWICRKRKAKRVDHCHKTNKIRGVLCGFCNPALTIIDNENDPIEMLERIKKYLLINN